MDNSEVESTGGPVADDRGSLTIRAIFLSVFLIVGFVSNCLLVAIIAQSKRLRSSEINRFLLSIAAANIINCGCIMPIMLSYTVRDTWDLGDFVCRLNAALIQITTSTVLFSLFLLVLERTVTVLKAPPDGTKSHRAIIFIAIIWFFPTVFAIPLFISQVTDVEANSKRLLCHVTKGPPIYNGFLLGICYALPFLVTLILLCIILKEAVNRMLAEPAQPESFSQLESQTRIDPNDDRLRKDLNTAKFVAFLFLVWCILEGPYIVMDFIEIFGGPKLISGCHIAFTWMKFSYTMVVPLLTLSWRKEVWQKLKNKVLCRKSNLINDSSPRTSPRHNGDTQAGNPNGASASSIHVPVLYATGDGMFVKSRETDDEEITKKKCDVQDDTSDYDSQGEEENNEQRTKQISQTGVQRSRPNSLIQDSGVESCNGTGEKRRKTRNNSQEINKLDEREEDEAEVLNKCEEVVEGDRVAEDSGRGSIEIHKPKKKKKRRKETQDVELAEDMKKKKKKKKKRKDEDCVEMSEVTVPPMRLPALDHKPSNPEISSTTPFTQPAKLPAVSHKKEPKSPSGSQTQLLQSSGTSNDLSGLYANDMKLIKKRTIVDPNRDTTI